MMFSTVEHPADSLEAWRDQQAHTHRFAVMIPGIEICGCGATRAAHPDDR